MRPLFAIAPLAFVLALFSPSPAELSASLASFKAMFASSDKGSPRPVAGESRSTPRALDH